MTTHADKPRRRGRASRRNTPPAAPPPTNTGTADGNKATAAAFPPQLAAALALAVAALAALGVSGDALVRTTRNMPMELALAMGGVILGGVSLAIAGMLDSSKRGWGSPRRWQGAGLVFVLLGLAGVLAVAADSVSKREMPLVTMQATQPPVPAPTAPEPTATPMTTLTVTVRASNVKSDQQMMVQVIGLKHFDGVDLSAVSPCEGRHAFGGQPTSPPTETGAAPWGQDDYGDFHGVDPSVGDVLLWNRVGPKADGTIDATYRIDVPFGAYEGACAFAPLPDERNAAQEENPTPGITLDNGEYRPDDEAPANSVAYIRLETTARG